jgi:hypothetical protein
MIPPDVITTGLLIIKWMTLAGLLLYAIFAGIIVRQEQLMDRVIDETFEPILRVLTWLHFLLSLALVFFAFRIL